MLAWPAMPMPRVAVPVAAALLLGALFAGDSVWLALAALLAAAGWCAFGLAGRTTAPGGGLALLGLLLALAAWSGISIAWSVAPDLSWDELDRLLVYAAFLALGLVTAAAGRAGCRLAATLLAGALGAAVVWALAGKSIPALFPDGARAARLRDPIGYWNALALAADMLFVLALVLAADARARIGRAGWTVLAYAAVLAVALAASRAGVVALVLGAGLLVALLRDRLETVLLGLVAGVPAGALAAWAFTRPALVEDAGSHAERVADGAWFGLLFVAGAALVALGVAELSRRRPSPAVRTRITRALTALAIVAALGVVAGAAANAGTILDEFRGGELSNDPDRFKSFSANNRLAWWGEAWDVFAAEPLLGAGADSFEVARKRYRDNASRVTQPHSVPLQILAGTGIVGLALFAALVAAAAAAGAGAVRRLDGGDRHAAAALAVALALWLLHALVDYDWSFVAVTGPAFFAAGALAAAGTSPRPVPRLAAAGFAALGLAAAVSVVTPWLAERSVREVGRELDAGDLGGAAAAAARARSLDPLSLEPVLAEARIEERRGDHQAALAAYRDAARVQPENPESWYQLGLFEFDSGDRCSAYVHLNHAYTLDPAGTQWTPDSELVQALAWVNEGNC
jgi:tetratricopeptide (TPR) repeat protein